MLKSDGEMLACVVRDQESRRKLLLKQALTADACAQMKNEYRMLSLIHRHDAVSEEARSFPALRGCEESKEGFWFARDWIEGHTIADLVDSGREEPGMERTAALDCLISVTEKLVFLHGLNPALIHRDIKPQNIVVDEYGQCRLIDLGIARNYADGRDQDTVISGTRATAPPEQFGYRQTDARSDLYSCGVLLRYALTGDYREEADRRLPEDIRRVVEKATRFDPAQRYPSAQALLNDLLTLRFGRPAAERKHSRILTPLLCVALAVSLIAAAMPAIRRADLPGRIAMLASGAYTFREPLIEQAVRETLNLPEGPITQKELDEVTAIRIYGQQVFQSEEQLWLRGEHDCPYLYAYQSSGLWEKNGGITSLEDIKHMPNLRDLSLYNQNISDISALKDTQIVRLGLAHNPIESLAPLRGYTKLLYLNISSLPLKSISEVSTMANLQELNISSLPINSVELLTTLPLRRLQMYGMSLRNIWELQRMTGLETLELQNLDLEGVTALSHLPHLTSLTVTHPLGMPLQALEPLNKLEWLYYYGGETTLPESGVISLHNLSHLELNNGSFPHFKWLEGMPQLRELVIVNAQCGSLAGLDTAPLLMYIDCDDALAAEILSAYPERKWTVE